MNILIIDDHALFREGLCYVLRELQDDVTIHEACNYEQALEHFGKVADMDIVLLDLNIPGKNGFEILEIFSSQYPALPVVILSASNQNHDIQRALNAGAMGYIPKESTCVVMLNALKLIMAGGIYTPTNTINKPEGALLASKDDTPLLTPRQQEVLSLLVQGYSNKQIANDLNVAEATVKMHVSLIFRALGVRNRTQAALVTQKLGL